MHRTRYSFIDGTLWLLVFYLSLHVPGLHSRVDEFEQALNTQQQPPAESTQRPEPPKPAALKPNKCFHMDASACPTGQLKCARVDNVSVFCCDVDSFRLKEGLAGSMTQNVTRLHVLNASVDELDISQAVYRRLVSMAVTDGHVGHISASGEDLEEERNSEDEAGQFPKHSSLACLNISNNNLTSAKLQPSIRPPASMIARPFAYLFNLSTLDASGNNLTEFPLSLVHSNRKIFVDLSGNNYLPCKHFQRAMDVNSSSIEFINYYNTYCALDLSFNWFNNSIIVPIDRLRVQRELNAICRDIRPANISCQCSPERWELSSGDVSGLVAVDCSGRRLTEMPTQLPPNTVKLNVSYNNITSLKAVDTDPSYEHLRQLIVDHNDVVSIVELEGTKFIDNFMLFSITHNKLKTIHTYVLSNKFDVTVNQYITILLGGNYIHCDCNTEKVLKPWLVENFKFIPDYKSLMCDHNMGAVFDLMEAQVCHTPRDWTDYVNFIIGMEVFTLVLLISKVSYDYWVFKTAGYLPWPANKMPRLPCDWLCE